MNWLPEGTILGQLRLGEVFEQYDGPRLFTCESKTGQLYLVTWADEGEDHDLWLYLPVSRERFAVIRSGGVSVRDALVNAEDRVFVVKMPFAETEEITLDSILAGSDLPDEWLPDSDYMIELPTHTAPVASTPEELAIKAHRELRPILRLEVEPAMSKRTAAPTRAVGALLVSAQNLLDNVGNSLLSGGREISSKGRIRSDSLYETSSEVIGLSAASFVVDIASTRFNSLFGSVFEESAGLIARALATQGNSRAFKNQISGLHPRAAKSFRKFVRDLANFNGPATVVAASQDLRYVEANLEVEEINKLLAVLNYLAPDEEETVITGTMRLFMGDVSNQTFGLSDLKSEIRYTGYVDEDAMEAFGRARLNTNYLVAISATSVTDELTNETQHTYRLMKIIPV
ncbi:hypothetical protein OED52_13655 [Rhodococcus sp. Z13]|uniref:Uncharacterized protein n=1 Tax=Rhodococcus sacchari TaxID=2962047 RepID=A0ACD4DCC1_9NOCA|nr:DUF6575 domain-containing protein [Rhodococcus sp. Z13]UYP17717.1 hypothetical protein OED52_13655 [Rhodococcus sp. Z13]